MKQALHFLGILALALGTAHAHTQLSSSMPADKAVVETAPKEVVLHFNDPVRLTMLSIQKSGGAKQDLGPLPSAPAKDFSITAPALDAAHYVVSWRALSADTHALNGEFTFTVGAAGQHGEHAAQAGHGGTEHSQHAERHGTH